MLSDVVYSKNAFSFILTLAWYNGYEIDLQISNVWYLFELVTPKVNNISKNTSNSSSPKARMLYCMK